jgi:ribosomal protein S18 acetylase RimI-like enzyme
MVSYVDHRAADIAEQIYQLQQASYAVERDLIDYADFPPLRVTAADIRQEPGTFLGAWAGEALLGILSFTATPQVLDIGRLIVHPSAFRRGIASQLLSAAEHSATGQHHLTVSTAEKNQPAVALYQRHGYRVLKRSQLPDGLVLVRFIKELAENACR